MFTKLVVLAALLCSALPHAALAYSNVTVVSPPDLVNALDGGILYHKNALFGIPSYRETIAGRVVYATPGDRNGCDPINKTISTPPWPADENVIIMVDRGSCDFVEKVLNAENVEAIAVIIVDNRAWATDVPTMADDGKGHLVSIPSVVVTYATGRKIEDHIKNSPDDPVEVEMIWHVPRSDNKVVFEMWTSSHDINSEQLKRDFHEAMDIMAESIIFTPKFLFHDGRLNGCTGPNPHSWCAQYCTNHGRYCVWDTAAQGHAVKGAKLVEENLREMCVWQVVNATDNVEARIKWWDYVAKFLDDCSDDPQRWHDDCTSEALQQVGVSIAAVNQCMENSGGITKDQNNTIIEAMIAERKDKGVHWLPTMFINGDRHVGSWNCPHPIALERCNVLSAICAGFQPEHMPQPCLTSPGCDLGEERDVCGLCGGKGDTCLGCDGIPNSNVRNDVCGICGGTNTRFADCDSGSKGMGAGGVIGIVLAIVAVFAGVAFVYVRRQNKQMADIKSILSAYAPLDENGNASSQRGGGNDNGDGFSAVPTNDNSATGDDDVDSVYV